MTPEEKEEHWRRGYRACANTMLHHALGVLGVTDPETGKAAWLAEREDAVAALRRLCDDFGDTDWPADLHLADVIEKHLGRHLYEAKR